MGKSAVRETKVDPAVGEDGTQAVRAEPRDQRPTSKGSQDRRTATVRMAADHASQPRLDHLAGWKLTASAEPRGYVGSRFPYAGTGLSALPLLLYRLGATAGQRGQSRRWWRTRRRPTVRGLCWRRPRPATLRPVRLMPHICNSANRHSDDLRLLPGVRGSGSQGRRRRRMGSGAV
jgi:hypothetical protein